MEQRLKGRIALITGAGRGIGQACALRFGREGAHVYVNDRDGQTADETATQIRSAGGAATAIAADVTDQAAVAALIQQVVSESGRLDILLNNAGGDWGRPAHKVTIEEYHHSIALNLNSVFYCVHAVLPVMIEQRSGVILSISSGAGLNAVKGLSVYGAAKAGIANLMRNIAAEYGAFGIRANTISPGLMDTAGMRAGWTGAPGVMEKFISQIPVGRLGKTDDIASAAAYLASDDASYINGVVLPVDGGVHAMLSVPDLS